MSEEKRHPMGKIEDVVEGSIFAVTVFDTRKVGWKDSPLYKEAIAQSKKGGKIPNKQHFTAMGAIYYARPSHRTMGFYHAFEDAEWAVLNNVMDMCEAGTNGYVVIEAFHPGIHPIAIELQWHIWEGDDETGSYVKCDRPTGEDFDRIACWGMG